MAKAKGTPPLLTGGDAAILVGDDASIVDLSPAASDLLGLDRATALGKAMSCRHGVPG